MTEKAARRKKWLLLRWSPKRKKGGLQHMPQGVFKWFNPETGYGLIVPDVGRRKLFMVRSTNIADGEYKDLKSGDRVTYEVIQGKTGMQVKNVSKI